MPSARAIWLKQWKPLRRNRRAATAGAAYGDRERNNAAESSMTSSEITQDDSGLGERKRTKGR